MVVDAVIVTKGPSARRSKVHLPQSVYGPSGSTPHMWGLAPEVPNRVPFASCSLERRQQPKKKAIGGSVDQVLLPDSGQAVGTSVLSVSLGVAPPGVSRAEFQDVSRGGHVVGGAQPGWHREAFVRLTRDGGLVGSGRFLKDDRTGLGGLRVKAPASAVAMNDEDRRPGRLSTPDFAGNTQC